MYFISILVQIVLESLPISSSGHLSMLGLSMPEYIERLSFGATLGVLCIYFYKELLRLLKDMVQKKPSTWHWCSAWSLLIIMATSATVFMYVVLKNSSLHTPLWIGFCITSFLLFSLRWCPYGIAEQPHYGKMFIIGFVQGCAQLPGVSRLGSTYVAACWLGFSPYAAFRISCALQVPLFSAGFLEGVVKFFIDRAPLPTVSVYFYMFILLVLIIAMLVAYYLLWWIEYLMVQRKIWYVGWYMLVLAVVSFFIR